MFMWASIKNINLQWGWESKNNRLETVTCWNRAVSKLSNKFCHVMSSEPGNLVQFMFLTPNFCLIVTNMRACAISTQDTNTNSQDLAQTKICLLHSFGWFMTPSNLAGKYHICWQYSNDEKLLSLVAILLWNLSLKWKTNSTSPNHSPQNMH